MPEPDVTIVVPCRNERRTLRACLDALEAQDHSSYEVLVVDGRSVDGCREIARARGARLLPDPGRGPAAARNVGIHAARGDIIAFTDADCVPRFDWLAHITAPIHGDTSVAGVAGSLRMTRDTLIGRMEDNDARANYRGYITSNIAYRRDVLIEVGGFDETLCCAEDYDLAWRVIDAGHRIVHEPRAMVLHDQPEVRDGLADYLRKQFWYARNDIPAHARALARVEHAKRALPGSSLAEGGFASACTLAALVAAGALAAAARSPLAAGAALATQAIPAARHIARTAAAIEAPRDEIAAMIAIETCKRLARGAGTIAGLADWAFSSLFGSATSAVESALGGARQASARLAPSPA